MWQWTIPHLVRWFSQPETSMVRGCLPGSHLWSSTALRVFMSWNSPRFATWWQSQDPSHHWSTAVPLIGLGPGVGWWGMSLKYLEYCFFFSNMRCSNFVVFPTNSGWLQCHNSTLTAYKTPLFGGSTSGRPKRCTRWPSSRSPGNPWSCPIWREPWRCGGSPVVDGWSTDPPFWFWVVKWVVKGAQIKIISRETIDNFKRRLGGLKGKLVNVSTCVKPGLIRINDGHGLLIVEVSSK